jgi:hypothetical protein
LRRPPTPFADWPGSVRLRLPHGQPGLLLAIVEAGETAPGDAVANIGAKIDHEH